MLVAMTSVPICVRIDGLKGIPFLCLPKTRPHLLTAARGLRVSSLTTLFSDMATS